MNANNEAVKQCNNNYLCMFKHLRKEYHKKPPSFGWVGLILLILFGSFVFGMLGGLIIRSLDSEFFDWVKGSVTGEVTQETIIKEKTIKSLIEEEGATIRAVNKTLSSTVNILITKDLSQYYNQTGPFIFPFDSFGGVQPKQYTDKGGSKKTEIGGGSGFIISSDGLILTNKHVVSDPNAEYSVILSNDKKYSAKIIALDPFMDLAILKIDAKNLPVVTLGNSDKLLTGQTVIAIGYSLSEYQNTVTKGIVSGMKRRVSAQGETIDEAIQTDAAINPGNSGGPLINLKGEVIGINAAVNRQGQLIGFAIPINSAKRAIESVKKYGKIVRPWLGVRYILLNKRISEANNLSVNYGALLVRGSSATDFAVLPNSPADKAGLKEKDIILEVGGKKIDENNSLAKLIGVRSVGEKINLKILRQGKKIIVSVTLGEYAKKN